MSDGPLSSWAPPENAKFPHNPIGGIENWWNHNVTHGVLSSLFGDGKKSVPTPQQADQQLIANLPGSEQIAPDAATIQSLADALRGAKGSDFTKDWSQLSPTLQGDITKVWQGQTPQAATQTTGQGWSPDMLAQAFSGIYQNTLIPFLKTEEKNAQPGENALIAGLQQSLKGSSPQVRSALGTLPETLQAEQKMMDQATLQQAAGAPAFAALLQGLSQATTAEQAAKTAAQLAPYAQQAYSGQTPTIPGMAPVGGLVNFFPTK